MVGKVQVVPHRIDTERFQPGAKIQGLTVCVGRLSAEKNFGAAIMASLSWPRARMMVIGDGPNRREWELLAWVGRPKVLFKVLFTGAMDNVGVARILSSAEYLIHPALYEQAPKVILEAMACGCVVITTQDQYVTDGETGFLCGTSPESIVAAMHRAQESDRVAIGKAAREYVVANHA